MTLEETAEYTIASAGMHGAATADDIDGGFSDEDIEIWMETAVDLMEWNEQPL
jgi:3D (Asp-Asp-Asp) domain-containing protein